MIIYHNVVRSCRADFFVKRNSVFIHAGVRYDIFFFARYFK